MRTDVKIGLVCAFVIVMGAVIYFVAQPARPTKPKTTTDSLASGGTTPPATAPATAPSLASGSMGGPFILPPGSNSPMAGGSASAGSPSPADTVGGPTASAGATGGFGSAFGAPSMTGTTGTTGSANSGTASSGALASTFGPTSSSTTGTPSTGGTSRGTIDLSGASGSPFGAFGGSSANSATSGSSANTTGTTYVIQKSDMLGPIAHHFGVTVPAILAANPGLDANHLKIKAVINIPAGATPPATAPSARTSGSHGEATAAAAAPGSAKPGASYKIRKSDTLMTIARSAYGSEKDWKRIYNANKSEITDPNLVPVGLVIKIPQ